MSKKLTRRDFLKVAGAVTAGAAGAAGMESSAQQAPADKAVPSLGLKPESGASLRVLRWKRFVQGDEELWTKNTAAFSAKTGIAVRVDNEGWEDVRPKAAVAANVNSGPDIILSTFDDPDKFPNKLLDVTDIAEYLGAKYGGWFPVCEQYLKRNGRWIALPLGCAGNSLVHRISHVRAAGFSTFPHDTAAFLELCKALKAKGTPPGFALGNATGDANAWTHWVVWAFGGRMVDEHNKVVIDSPETVHALEYAKEMYATFVPGTLSWLDPNNNKAFLDGQISLTSNGISIYYAAKTSADPKLKDMAADIGHAPFPVGPVGKPTELNLFFNQMIFKYTKYPQAAKAYLTFMMEREQYEPWQQASIGYVTHPLKAYDGNPIWTVDPKHTPYRDAMRVMLPNGYAGQMGQASAQTMADFIMVNMVAQAATGDKTPKEAAKIAAERAKRYYKT